MKNLCLCMLFNQEHEPEGAKKKSKQPYLRIRVLQDFGGTYRVFRSRHHQKTVFCAQKQTCVV